MKFKLPGGKKRDKKPKKLFFGRQPTQQDPNQVGGMRDLNKEFESIKVEKQFRDDKRGKKRGPQQQPKGNLKNIEKKQRVNTLNYYTERLLNKMTQGSLDIQGSAFEISYSKIMSETHKKRVLFIKEFPTWIRAGHLERIRLEAKKLVPREDIDKVDVNIIQHVVNHHINYVNNKKIKSSERNFRRQLIDLTSEKLKKIAQVHTGATMLGATRDDISVLVIREERLKRKIYSYGNINKHQSGGGETIKSYIFIEVVGATNELTDSMTDKVTQLLTINNYKFEEVTDLTEYLSAFGLASLGFQKKMKWDIHPLTLTTNVSSLTPTYSEGIIRSAAGDVYIGNSMETGYPVFTSFSESAAASNVLVVADSGSGKTVLVKTIVLGCLNHRNNTYNVVVTDYKGGEWSSLIDVIERSEEVSMGIANPKFINTLSIPDYKKYGFPDAQSAYYLASSYTVKMLATLVGVQDKLKTSQVQNICNDIVERVYLYNGVDVKRPSTYYKSKDWEFSSVLWAAIQYITSQSEDMELRHGKELLGIVKTSLEYYFDINGSKRYMFTNSLDIDDLMEKKLIVFDYGAQTAGGQGSLLEKEVNAKVLQKNFFTTLYSAKNKIGGQYTIEIEEEVQRQLNSPILSKELNDKITGGRSSNRSTILLTNTIGAMLNNTGDLNITAIKENMNTVMLGRVKRNVAEDVMKYFNIEQARSRVEPILTSNENYSHAFLMAFNTGKVFDMCVARVTLPQRLIDSKIFESRKVEEYNPKEL